MNRHIVVVDQPSEWADFLPEHLLLSARDYIAGKSIGTHQTLKVINLCRSYRYLGLGYYVSLPSSSRPAAASSSAINASNSGLAFRSSMSRLRVFVMKAAMSPAFTASDGTA